MPSEVKTQAGKDLPSTHCPHTSLLDLPGGEHSTYELFVFKKNKLFLELRPSLTGISHFTIEGSKMNH
jgi:hypothetical protein